MKSGEVTSSIVESGDFVFPNNEAVIYSEVLRMLLVGENKEALTCKLAMLGGLNEGFISPWSE